MAKKRGKKNNLTASQALLGVTLRDENVGRKYINLHSVLKLQHLQRLATWAGGEASILPLAAHFGRMLATNAELEGIPLDRSIVSCQRCETILQPGYNCTVRIEKNARGAKHRKKSGTSQNTLVHMCHFCSHRNLRKGTPKGHMKDLLALRPKSIFESNLADSTTTAVSKFDKDATAMNDLNEYNEYVNGNPRFDVQSSPQKEVTRDIPNKDSPKTPKKYSPKTPSANVTQKKMKIAGSTSSKAANTGPTYATTRSGKDTGISNKRRRKGWSGLREITLSSEREKEQRMNNLAIPFLL